MDAAEDVVKLKITIAEQVQYIKHLRERIRQLEAERDQWQTRAVSNG
jgi:phage shock protein A